MDKERKNVSFNPNLPTEVELSFDEPKTGLSKYKNDDGSDKYWYLYGIKETVNGESSFFATQILHEILQGMGVKTGSKLVITKVVKDEKTTWDVKSLGGDVVEEKSIDQVVEGSLGTMNVNKPNEVKELSTQEKVNVMWDAFNKKGKKATLTEDDLPF